MFSNEKRAKASYVEHVIFFLLNPKLGKAAQRHSLSGIIIYFFDNEKKAIIANFSQEFHVKNEGRLILSSVASFTVPTLYLTSPFFFCQSIITFSTLFFSTQLFSFLFYRPSQLFFLQRFCP